MADKEAQRFSFYRYHIPDPVYFDKNCRVTIQQIGGTNKKEVVEMLDQGVPIKPISADDNGRFVKLLEPGQTVDLRKDIADSSWVNYCRQDDVCAVAFFYLDSPTSNLPPLVGVEKRILEMK